MLKSRTTPVQADPVRRAEVGKPSGGTANASIINTFALPVHEGADGLAASSIAAMAPSFLFPPLPFADDGAE